MADSHRTPKIQVLSVAKLHGIVSLYAPGLEEAQEFEMMNKKAQCLKHSGPPSQAALSVDEADEHLIKGFDFSLTNACPLNGLVTARSALRTQASQIVVGRNTSLFKTARSRPDPQPMSNTFEFGL